MTTPVRRPVGFASTLRGLTLLAGGLAIAGVASCAPNPTPYGPAAANKGYGYFEDRRPAANADPYEVCARILKTICDVE